MDIHNIGRTTGKEIIVKREPLPPAFATIAANMVVEEAIANPPATTIAIKVKGDLISICKKNIKRGVIISCNRKNREILKISFDKRITSGLAFNLKNRDVPCSSSLMKMWDSPFMALKNRIIQNMTDCILMEIGIPPDDRLMAKVDMIAKDMDTFSA